MQVAVDTVCLLVGGTDSFTEGRQHRVADSALGHHVRRREAALPGPGGPRGDQGNEPRAAGTRRDRHGALRRPHALCADPGRRPAGGRDDADPAAGHLAVLAGPRQPRAQGVGRRRAGTLLDAAPLLPRVGVPAVRLARPVPAPSHDADGHTQSK